MRVVMGMVMRVVVRVATPSTIGVAMRVVVGMIVYVSLWCQVNDDQDTTAAQPFVEAGYNAGLVTHVMKGHAYCDYIEVEKLLRSQHSVRRYGGYGALDGNHEARWNTRLLSHLVVGRYTGIGDVDPFDDVELSQERARYHPVATSIVEKLHGGAALGSTANAHPLDILGEGITDLFGEIKHPL